MIYKWGGDFIEGNFPKGGIFTKGIFLRGNSMGVIFTGGNLIRIWVLAKSKKENYDPAHKMVEKFGKSRVYQFVLVELVPLLINGIVAHSFTCGRSPCSFIIVSVIATKYFCQKWTTKH